MPAETLITHGTDTAGNLITVTTTIERTPPTVFGVAPPGTEMPQHHAVYGPLGYPRFFFGPGKVPGWDLYPLRNLQPGDIPVVSAKTWFPDAFRTMLDEAPVGEWWYCQNHEPEDDFSDGTLTVSGYMKAWDEIRKIRDAHPRGGRCKLVPILNWYQLTQRGFDWRRLAPAIDLGDAIGVDSYALAADATRNIYTSPDALFGPAMDIADATGLPWCVPEFAARMAADQDKGRHAAQIKAYAAYVRAHGAKWVSWWCNPAGGYIPHLCTTPLYDQALTAWQTAVRG